jgi:hypothetical protein
VAESAHQVGEGRPGLGGEGLPGVPEVVEAQVFQPGAFPGPLEGQPDGVGAMDTLEEKLRRA